VVSVTAAQAWLGLVLQRFVAQTGIINLDCRFRNQESRPVSIHRVEAWITDPHHDALHLGWHIFYKTEGTRQTMTGPAEVVTLAPGETRTTGVQFTPPPSIRQYRWSPGVYSLDLVAWLSPPRPGDRPALIAPYEIRVDQLAADRVATWRAEFEAQRDPDNAISIPVEVVPAKTR
jgi:hypothetical protein